MHTSTPHNVKRQAWRKEPGTDQRKLVGRPWRRLRDAVLLRDQYTCQECKRVCLPSDLAADHVVPLSKGGRDDASNLQALCTGPVPSGGCHLAKTVRENGGREKPTYGVDGWQL